MDFKIPVRWEPLVVGEEIESQSAVCIRILQVHQWVGSRRRRTRREVRNKIVYILNHTQQLSWPKNDAYTAADVDFVGFTNDRSEIEFPYEKNIDRLQENWIRELENVTTNDGAVRSTCWDDRFKKEHNLTSWSYMLTRDDIYKLQLGNDRKSGHFNCLHNWVDTVDQHHENTSRNY